MLVVLVLLSVMLPGGLGLARMTEVGSLIAGNISFKERAVQSAEIAYSAAFTRVLELADENADTGSWYYATMRPQDADGTPTGIDWSATPEINVGAFNVRYVIERLCQSPPIVDVRRQCLVRMQDPGVTPQVQSQRDDASPLDAAAGRQFRITIRVTGPKDTVTFVQGMVTRS
jgi:type IV pilus assembly protein PilX